MKQLDVNRFDRYRNHAVNNGPLSIPFKPPGFRHDVLLNAGQEARMPALWETNKTRQTSNSSMRDFQFRYGCGYIYSLALYVRLRYNFLNTYEMASSFQWTRDNPIDIYSTWYLPIHGRNTQNGELHLPHLYMNNASPPLIFRNGISNAPQEELQFPGIFKVIFQLSALRAN